MHRDYPYCNHKHIFLYRDLAEADISKPFYQLDNQGAYKQVSVEALTKCATEGKTQSQEEVKKG